MVEKTVVFDKDKSGVVLEEDFARVLIRSNDNEFWLFKQEILSIL